MTLKVLTITFNPTVDKSSTVDKLQPEKKLRCSMPVYEAGGGGINVSRGLERLGISSVALYPSGGRTGELLQELLSKENINSEPVPVAAETRENFIVVDTSHNNQYRFGMPGEPITDKEADALHKAIFAIDPLPEIVVISGSLPEGLSTDFLINLVKELKAKKIKVIADTSGDALTAILKEGVYLVKPNIGELSKFIGKEELDNESADEAARELVDKGAAEIVAVSMGPQGAYVVTKDECIHVNAPSVKKQTTVGAGDSMVAGMVAVLAKGGSVTEMARMGVACGTAATMGNGTGLFTKENAEKLYKWLSK
ncbi:1-phosphofructokinase family hexose kinase [Flavobacterium sp. DG1-102-2]|uniref:1-phosphofructokinase family hexose kinase n=1 Tax=Flavobacterium sp. DG1-102-2 TaxID=3081663 RepID=UPI0029495778|nr:1-phosphofructokinase family hexose kinase [Flavobacterium sp. DG1-102-2]MDV6167927.1 1-phosphofructokinase family hexose kinase [Flavobacterium sp. DG1-102-2]